MKAFVFLGPTLSRDAAAELLSATYLPPVSQGDVYRAALAGPDMIGIIDGYFDRIPSVWHKEILWAMARGIHVFGSASMGALRAAELEPFGMVGVGQIFEAYRDGTLEDDDEVAVAHTSADDGYRCVSEAMVNIRTTLARAQTTGVLSAGKCQLLQSIAKALHYADRSYPEIVNRAITAGLTPAELDGFKKWLPLGHVDQKRQDAMGMLRLMKEQWSAGPGPKRVGYKVEPTVYWHQVMRSAGVMAATVTQDGMTMTVDDVMDEIRLKGKPFLDAFEGSRIRKLAVNEVSGRGYEAPAAAVESRVHDFCITHGLSQPEEFSAWLAANDLPLGRFKELIAEQVMLDLVPPDGNGLSGLLDHLRLSDAYRSLRERARDKHEQLARAGMLNVSLQDAGINLEQLLGWYSESSGIPPIDDPEAHARRFGFADGELFVRALFREYCYTKRKYARA